MRVEEVLICDLAFLQKVNDMYKAQTGNDWFTIKDGGVEERDFMQEDNKLITNYSQIHEMYEALNQSEKDTIDAFLGDWSDKVKNSKEVNFPTEI